MWSLAIWTVVLVEKHAMVLAVWTVRLRTPQILLPTITCTFTIARCTLVHHLHHVHDTIQPEPIVMPLWSTL
jgi:hypothetical protein